MTLQCLLPCRCNDQFLKIVYALFVIFYKDKPQHIGDCIMAKAWYSNSLGPSVLQFWFCDLSLTCRIKRYLMLLILLVRIKRYLMLLILLVFFNVLCVPPLLLCLGIRIWTLWFPFSRDRSVIKGKKGNITCNGDCLKNCLQNYVLTVCGRQS